MLVGLLSVVWVDVARADCADGGCAVVRVSSTVPANGAPIVEIVGGTLTDEDGSATGRWTPGDVVVTDDSTGSRVDITLDAADTGPGFLLQVSGAFSPGATYDVDVPACVSDGPYRFVVGEEADTTAPTGTPTLDVTWSCRADSGEDELAGYDLVATVKGVEADLYEVDVDAGQGFPRGCTARRRRRARSPRWPARRTSTGRTAR